MPNLQVATKAASAPTRFTTPFQRTAAADKITKIEIEDIIRSHKPTTNIIAQIKKANGPFYANLTPDMCLDLLSLNDFNHNRNLNWVKINGFLEQMNIGEWCNNNGDTISISTEMQLIDGQNRLVAAYMAGYTLEFMIIAPNCPPKSFAYKDIGENRSASDMATINGFGTNKVQVAYCVKSIIMYEKTGQIRSTIFKNRVRNYEVNKFMQDTKKMNRIIDDIGIAKTKWAHDTNFFTPPQWATAYYILRTLPHMEDEARKFIDKFADGNDMKANSPIRVARRHFETDFKHLLQGKQRNRITSGLLTIKLNTLFTAWNHYVNKESVSDIKIDAESKYIVKPNFR